MATVNSKLFASGFDRHLGCVHVCQKASLGLTAEAGHQVVYARGRHEGEGYMYGETSDFLSRLGVSSRMIHQNGALHRNGRTGLGVPIVAVCSL